MLLVLLAIAAWRITHFIQSDSLFEPVREFIYWFFPAPNWYTTTTLKDNIEAVGDPNFYEITRYRTRRLFRSVVDDLGDWYFYAVKESKIGELVSCLWCLSIWTSAAVVFGYFIIVPSTALIDQLVSWLVVASGVVVIEKVVDRL